jgi:hypothetical protein
MDEKNSRLFYQSLFASRVFYIGITRQRETERWSIQLIVLDDLFVRISKDETITCAPMSTKRCTLWYNQTWHEEQRKFVLNVYTCAYVTHWRTKNITGVSLRVGVILKKSLHILCTISASLFFLFWVYILLRPFFSFLHSFCRWLLSISANIENKKKPQRLSFLAS